MVKKRLMRCDLQGDSVKPVLKKRSLKVLKCTVYVLHVFVMCFFIFVFAYTTCINNNMSLWFSQVFYQVFFFHDVFSMAKHLLFFYI